MKMRQDLRELRECDDAELQKKLLDAKDSLYNMRVNAITGKMENTADMRNEKRHIARIKTEINIRKKNNKAS